MAYLPADDALVIILAIAGSLWAAGVLAKARSERKYMEALKRILLSN